MTTYTAKAGQVQQGWYVVDAQDKVLGRLAVQIATRLRGKHKPEYTPHIDTGDFIVVVNAAQTEQLLFGEQGIAARLRPGSVVIACATISAAAARRIGATMERADCRRNARRGGSAGSHACGSADSHACHSHNSDH